MLIVLEDFATRDGSHDVVAWADAPLSKVAEVNDVAASAKLATTLVKDEVLMPRNVGGMG
jgi:hypothetical protein